MQLSPLDCLKNPVQAPPPKLLDAIPGLGTHSKLSHSLPSCFQSGLLHFSIQIILLPERPAAPEGIVYPKKGPNIQETPPTHRSREARECQILPRSLFLDPPSAAAGSLLPLKKTHRNTACKEFWMAQCSHRAGTTQSTGPQPAKAGINPRQEVPKSLQ